MNNCQYYHNIFTTLRKFYHEILILEQNSRNHESFLPQKFGAIQYRGSTIVLVIVWIVYIIDIGCYAYEANVIVFMI